MSLLRRGSRFMLSSFSAQSSSAWRLLFPLFLFLHTPHSFREQPVLLVLVTLLDIVVAVYQGYYRIGESHPFIILLGPYRRFPGTLEEVQAGPSLYTLSLSP